MLEISENKDKKYTYTHLQLFTVLYMNTGVQKMSETAHTMTVIMLAEDLLRKICDNEDELWHTIK